MGSLKDRRIRLVGQSAAFLLLAWLGCGRQGVISPSPTGQERAAPARVDGGAVGGTGAAPGAQSPIRQEQTGCADAAVAELTHATGGASSVEQCDECTGGQPRTKQETVLQETMTGSVYRDQDYRQFICGDTPCTQSEFRKGLEFRREVLKEHPEVIGYFVEPSRKAENFYTGFFVMRGNTPRLQFIFFGMDLGSIKRKDPNGFRLVAGAERRGSATYVDTLFRWNGSAYVEFSSIERSDEP